MKKSASPVAVVVAAIVFISCADDPTQPRGDSKPQFSQAAAGRYIIELKGNDISGLSAAVAAVGGNLEFAHADAGIATVSGLTAEGAAELARANGVGGVHQDIRVQLAPEGATTGAAASASMLSPTSPTTALLYSWQWHLRRVGADLAWAAGRLGSPDVTVAIIDSGIDTENLDLAGRVDLARSRSFVEDDDAFMDIWLPTHPKIEDLDGHGTHVASQVASNAVFFAGVTSRVTLIAIKVLDRDQSGFLSDALLGVLHAADQGADVANMSIRWSGGLSKQYLSEEGKRIGWGSLFAVTNVVFNYAHRKGMVLVVIPGNEEENMDHEGLNFRPFCEAPHVICVSATGPTASADLFTGPWENEDAFAPYSNYGKAITLSAPGGTRQGWIWAVCPRRRITGYVPNTNPSEPIFGCLTPSPNNAFIVGGIGTSLAAPQVAGLAALLVEDLGKNNPSAIKNALLKSVDDLGENGHDPLFGAGRINIPRALGLK